MSNTVDRLEREIEELEAANKPEVVEVVDNPEGIATPEAVETEYEVKVDKPKRTNWKQLKQQGDKRLAGIKASSDKFKFESRQEIADLKARLEQLQSVPTVEVDPFKDIFSQEDADVVGDEAIEIMKKAAKAASLKETEALKKELDSLKRDAEQRRTNASKKAEDDEYDEFLAKLGSKVDNWESINRDPAFIDYLAKVDEDSGYTRQEVLVRAETSRDVGRIAGFMKDFEVMSSPGNKELESKVGPTGTPSPSAQIPKEGKVVLDGSYVDLIYDNIIKGKYRSDPSLAREKQLEVDKALAEGRVDFSR